MSLEDLFGSSGQITVGQECARAVLVLIYGLFLVRVAGRRAFGKWAALDIIVSIVIGSNLSRAITGNAPLFGTMAATAVIMGLHYVLAAAAALWRSASRLLEGAPIPLAVDGLPDRSALIRHGVSEADLNEALRQAGVDLAQTSKITLEPSGKLTLLKRAT